MDWDFVFRATQAIGTVALGTGALAIAILKWRDDREKLKNDLWQSRFEIYQQAMYSINAMKIEGKHNWKETVDFKVALHKSKFAFPTQEPHALMNEIWDIWWTYNIYYRRNDKQSHETDFNKLKELDNRFAALNVDETFEPFLKRRI